MARRVWDRFDEEAEREGAAFTKQVMTQIIKGGGREGKKIVFYDSDKRHAELKIKKQLKLIKMNYLKEQLDLNLISF